MKLKTRNIVVLTEGQTSMVAGGVKAMAAEPTDGCIPNTDSDCGINTDDGCGTGIDCGTQMECPTGGDCQTELNCQTQDGCQS